MSKRLNPGDRVDGYCHGEFPIEQWDTERVVKEVGPDWVLLEANGRPQVWHGNPKQLKRNAKSWAAIRAAEELYEND